MAELLSVPLKKSTDVDIVKPLKSLIQSTYNTEEYNDALTELGRLRTNAIWKVFEKSSLDVLYGYYDQLVSLESKLPPQEVQVPFKWKDAFDKGSIFGARMSLTVSSLAFERVCVQFNIAALQSCLAAQLPLDSDTELQQAARLFQQAAGLFQHLKGAVPLAVHADPTPDLLPDTLHALAQLMLAQAQECVAYKCIRDEMKDAMVARVCACAAELYGEAARAMAREAPRATLDREWPAAVQARAAALGGLAQAHQAAVCRAAQRPGEELARLQLAAAALAPLARVPPLGEALRRVRARLVAAQKDNDFIYHERVPPPEQLEPVRGAAVAKPLPPQSKYTEAADLFGGLAPAGVHRARAAAEARRAEAVAGEVAALREATATVNAVLASLNLPACLEEQGGAELPASIRAKAAALRAAGGVPALRRLMRELPDLLQRNREILDEAERLLREEAEADAALRAQFGARWTRTPSARLTDTFRANADKYRQIIDNAVRADSIVQQKLQLHEESMERLCGSEDELAAGLPAGGGGGGGASSAAAADELRSLLRDVEQLKRERDALEGELAASRLEPGEPGGPAPDEAALAGALGAALGPLRARAAQLLQRQRDLEERLRAAHAQLPGRGPGAGGGGAGARDAALARLCAAHDAYQELTGNLQEGAKFYNDLTQLLVAFQSKVSDFCFARRAEKEELLKDLTQDAARPAPAPPAPAQEAAVERRSAPPRPAPPAPAAPAAAPAPLPYPTQPHGMPLPLAPAAPYPYYCAPLPALYNPYATLPYPHHAGPPRPAYQPYQHPAPGPGPGPAPAPGYQPPPGGYSPYPQHPQ